MRSYEKKSEEVLAPSEAIEDTGSHLEGKDASLGSTTATIPEDMLDVSEEDISQEQQGRRLRKSPPAPPAPPTREQVWTMIAFWGVVLLGAVLRFWDLGAKPLHWDESLHAYYSMQLLHNNIQNWAACLNLPPTSSGGCYRYDPLLHGPFQFHAIALVYLISQILGAADHGINTTTVRIAAALLGTVMVGLPYFLRQYIGKIGAWLACFLLAVSPSLVYFSRFAREDIYMACFTLMLVVAVVQYVRTRKIGWAILAGLSFVLSYATKEATFLSIAVFGSFAGALLVWEIASRGGWNAKASQASAPATMNAASFQPSFSASEVVLHEPTTEASSEVTTDVDDVEHQTEISDAKHGDQLQPLPVSEEHVPSISSSSSQKILTPRIFVLLALLIYFVVIGIPAVLLLNWTKRVSIYTNASPANMNAAQAIVNNLKNITVQSVPWLGIVLAVVVFFLLWREQSIGDQPRQRRGLASRVDPQNQRLLDAIVTMPWTHWFFALVVGWSVFLVLFTALFTYMPGIGEGIWQGIFYWITQQTVARGGEPWYYYFMLVPLYEQIGLIFGLVGIIYCLMHPTRFRIFMIYWFVGNFFIYTWAGEKMPWLVIHLTMPMMILAGIGLRPVVERLAKIAKDMFASSALKREKPVQSEMATEEGRVLASKAIGFLGEFIIVCMVVVAVFAEMIIALLDNTLLTILCGILIACFCGSVIAVLAIFRFKPSPKVNSRLSAGGAIFGGIVAILALILTLQNMYQVTYPHPADAKSEMLIYVQTTPSVNTVMDKIAQLDQKYYGGRYEIPIGVTVDASWPFSWYLRDYKEVAFSCTVDTCKNYPVVISAGDALSPMSVQNSVGQYSYNSQYNYQTYEMRAQGNQGYMPPPCTPTKEHPCDPQQYTGVGLGMWLSWGANPPPHATFDLGRATMRVWQWWWQRIPIGRGVKSRGDQVASDDQGAMMGLFIRKNLGVAP